MAQIGTVLEPGQIPGSRVPGISQLPGSGTGNRGKPSPASGALKTVYGSASQT